MPQSSREEKPTFARGNLTSRFRKTGELTPAQATAAASVSGLRVSLRNGTIGRDGLNQEEMHKPLDQSAFREAEPTSAAETAICKSDRGPPT